MDSLLLAVIRRLMVSSEMLSIGSGVSDLVLSFWLCSVPSLETALTKVLLQTLSEATPIVKYRKLSRCVNSNSVNSL